MIEALRFVLESYWNTIAVIVALAVFRPVRITIKRDDPSE